MNNSLQQTFLLILAHHFHLNGSRSCRIPTALSIVVGSKSLLKFWGKFPFTSDIYGDATGAWSADLHSRVALYTNALPRYQVIGPGSMARPYLLAARPPIRFGPRTREGSRALGTQSSRLITRYKRSSGPHLWTLYFAKFLHAIDSEHIRYTNPSH